MFKSSCDVEIGMSCGDSDNQRSIAKSIANPTPSIYMHKFDLAPDIV